MRRLFLIFLCSMRRTSGAVSSDVHGASHTLPSASHEGHLTRFWLAPRRTDRGRDAGPRPCARCARRGSAPLPRRSAAYAPLLASLEPGSVDGLFLGEPLHVPEVPKQQPPPIGLTAAVLVLTEPIQIQIGRISPFGGDHHSGGPRRSCRNAPGSFGPRLRLSTIRSFLSCTASSGTRRFHSSR